MSTKKREVIWGGRIMGADMRAQTARQELRKAARAADRAEAEAWSVRMEGYGGPAQPSPTIGQCLNGGYGKSERLHHPRTLGPRPAAASTVFSMSNEAIADANSEIVKLLTPSLIETSIRL